VDFKKRTQKDPKGPKIEIERFQNFGQSKATRLFLANSGPSVIFLSNQNQLELGSGVRQSQRHKRGCAGTEADGRNAFMVIVTVHEMQPGVIDHGAVTPLPCAWETK
jgi:hypothetical protein